MVRGWTPRGSPAGPCNNEASIKTQKVHKGWVQGASGLVTPARGWEGGTLRGDMEVPRPSHIPCAGHLFHVAVLESCPFIIDW